MKSKYPVISLTLLALILGSSYSLTYAIEDSTDSSNVQLSCNCVAFRFDDVQNNWLNNVQIKIINTFNDREVPLTLGVIGKNFGTDKNLSKSIKAMINEEFEIANHGWEHEDFSKYTKEEQSNLLNLSNKAIQESLGILPTVFIPPMNSFNNETLSAMEENGLKYFSTELDESDVIYKIGHHSIYHFPEGATTGELNKNSMIFEGLSNQETFAGIVASLENNGFAVVTLHPQEFSIIEEGVYTNNINQDQIDELNLLIDKINEDEIQIVLISEINEKSSLIEFKKGQIPSWVKMYANWWSKNQISDSLFAKGIERIIPTEVDENAEIDTFEENEKEPIIPLWLRNNAQWWSEDLLSEKEFVNAIQFLVSKQIIQV